MASAVDRLLAEKRTQPNSPTINPTASTPIKTQNTRGKNSKVPAAEEKPTAVNTAAGSSAVERLLAARRNPAAPTQTRYDRINSKWNFGTQKQYNIQQDEIKRQMGEYNYNALQDALGRRDSMAAQGQSYEDWYKGEQGRKTAADETLKRLQEEQEQLLAQHRSEIILGSKDMSDPEAVAKALGEGTSSYSDRLKALEAEINEAKKASTIAGYIAEMADEMRFDDISGSMEYQGKAGAGQKAFEEAASAAEAAESKEYKRQEADYYAMGGGAAAPFEQSQIQQLKNDTTWREPTEDWTQAERDRFYYLYAKDPEEAYAYGEKTNNKHKAESFVEKQGKLEDWTTQNFGTKLAGTAAAVATMPMAIKDFADIAVEYAARGTVTQKKDISLFDAGNIMSAAVTDSLNQSEGKLNKLIQAMGGNGTGDLYQIGLSAMQSLVYANALGAAGTAASYFAAGAVSGFEDAYARGVSVESALTYGLAAGAAESIAEGLNIEKLLRIEASSSLKGMIKNALKQGVSEGGEELATQLMDTLADIWINGDKSRLEFDIQNYMLAGMSAEEAKRKATEEWLKETAFAFISGAASGTLSGGVQTGITSHRQYQGDIQRLVDDAMKTPEGSSARTTAQGYAARAEAGKGITNREALRLEEQIKNSTEEAVSKNQRDSIKKAAMERLMESGATESDAERLAELIAKEKTGEKISREERELITGGKGSKAEENIKAKAEAMLLEKGVSASAAAELATVIAKDRTGQKISMQERNNLQATQAASEVRKAIKETDMASFDSTAAVRKGIKAADYKGEAQKIVAAERAAEKGKSLVAKNVPDKVLNKKNIKVNTGEGEAELTGISYKNGEITLNLKNEDGSISHMAANEAELPEDVKTFIDNVAQYGSGAPMMFASMEPGQNMADFIPAYTAASELFGRNTTLDIEAARAAMATIGMNGKLSREQFTMAFNEGRRRKEEDAKRSTEEKAKAKQKERESERGKSGRISYAGGIVNGVMYHAVDQSKLNEKQKRQIAAIELLAEKTGIEFIFYESQADDKGKLRGANGIYSDGKIYLDVNAGANSKRSMKQIAIVRAAAHELTHYMQQYAQEQYEELKSFMLSHLVEMEGKDFNSLVAEKLNRDSTGKLTYAGALDEIVADGCEMMLRRTKVMQTMATEKPSLFETIKEWLSGWLEKLEAAFEGVEPYHREARSMLNYMDSLQEMWDRGLVKAVTEPVDSGQGTKYSYAGERAATADRDMLLKAMQLEEQGTDNETMRRETGWFRGMDGKWRFEVDDSRVQLKLEGTIIVDGGIKHGAYLGEIIDHPALFEAYPNLRGIYVRFRPLSAGHNGSYNVSRKEITVNSQNISMPERVKTTLLHEIQHAIQHDESFAYGASEEYWQERIEGGFDARRAEVKQKLREVNSQLSEIEQTQPEFYAAMMELEKLSPTVPRGKVLNWDTLESEPDPPEWVKFDEERDAIEAIYGDMAVWDFMDLRYKKSQYEGDPGRTPVELYYSTAGEIEARDVAKRRDYTAEQRKNTRPDVYQEDVVFADRAGSSASKLKADHKDKTHTTIKKQLQTNQTKLNAMEVVADVNLKGSEIPKRKTDVLNWAMQKLSSWKNGIERQGFGTVEISKNHINDGLDYLNTPAEYAAFLAVPRVIKRGIQIDYHKEHSGNANKASYTFAAPVTINGARGNMAVVVNYTTKNRYHVHRILMPDGSEFIFKEKTELTPDARSLNEKLLRPIGSVDTSIRSAEAKSNTQNEKFEGQFSERDFIPDDRELLLEAAEQKGASTELKNYRRKVASLEKLESLLAAQQKLYDSGDTVKDIRKDIKKKTAELKKTEEKLELKTAQYEEAKANELMPVEGKQRLHNDVLSLEKRRQNISKEIADLNEALQKDEKALAAEIEKTKTKIARAENSLEGIETAMKKDLAELRTEWSKAKAEETEKALRELRADNRRLRERVEFWKRESKLTGYADRRAKASDIVKLTGSLIDEMGSSARTADVAYMLQEVADYMVSDNRGEGMDGNELQSKARRIARTIIDSVWSGTTDPETGEEIVWKTYRSGAERTEVIGLLSNEIIDRIMSGEVSTVKTTADKNFEQVQQRAIDLSLANKELQEEMRRRDREHQKELARKDKDVEWNSRVMAQAKISELRAKSVQRDKEYRKRIAIRKKVEKLSKLVTGNDPKKPVPESIKAPLAAFLTEIDTLSKWTKETGRKLYADRITDLEIAIFRQQQYQEGESYNGDRSWIELPKDMADLLAEHKEAVKETISGDRGWVVQEMGLTELEQLEKILQILDHSIENANQQLAGERRRAMAKIALKTINYTDSMNEYQAADEKLEKVKNFVLWDNLTPYQFFKRLGEGGMEIFHNLQKGWAQFAYNAQAIIEFSKTAFTPEDVKLAEESIVRDIKLHKRIVEKHRNEDGEIEEEFLRSKEAESVTMTRAQIMSIYALWQREQARTHMLSAGIRIANYKDGRKNVQQAANYLLTEEEIMSIIGRLTESEKAIVDRLQRYMNTVCSEWGNEVSMKRFGIKQFTEPHYWPIKTEDNNHNIPDTDQQNSMFRLLNMSFTKPLTKNARNSIVIESAFDTFTAHTADMAKYNGLGLAVSDAIKFFNYKDIVEVDEESGQMETINLRRSLERAYGKNAERYFTTFMKDLNGTKEGGGRGEGLFGGFVRNSKIAAVGANARTVMLQPTSYVRALDVIDAKYLRAGITSSAKAGREKALKYSGTAVWKDLGFYDTNIGMSLREKIKQDSSRADQLRELSMKGAEKADQITWGALWNACEAQVKGQQQLSGEELMKATAELFDEVVYRTQVMDSTMTKSHIMRDGKGLAGMVTAFMSEPTLSFNMAMQAFTEFNNELRQGKNRSEAWLNVKDNVKRALLTYTATAAASAVVESLADAFRDDDKYQSFAEKWLEAMTGGGKLLESNLVNNLMLSTKLPLVSDLISIMQGYEEGRTDTQWFVNLKRSYEIWREVIGLSLGIIDEPTDVTYNGNMTAWGVIYDSLKTLSQISGLPAANLTRDIVALYNNTVAQFTENPISTYSPGPKGEIKYAVRDGYISAEEANEMLIDQELVEDEDEAYWLIREWTDEDGDFGKYDELTEALRAGDSTAFETAANELTEHGVKQSAVESKVRSTLREWYEGDDEGTRAMPDKQKVIRYLQEFGGKSEEEARQLVEQWTCKVVTGIAYSDIKTAYLDGDISADRAAQLRKDYGGYSETDAAKTVEQWKFEKETGIAYSEMQEAFENGELTATEFVENRAEIGKSEDYVKAVAAYGEYAAPAGMSKESFYSKWVAMKDMTKDVDADGNTVTSLQEKRWAFIDSLNLSAAQKDVLHLAFYDAKTLKKTPWHN